jgi:hypothetical protein
MAENPESLYPPDPDRPEPVEDEPIEETVEVTQQELDELGEFLGSVQKAIVAHEARIGAIERFLTEVLEAYAVDEGESQGEDQSQPSGDQKPSIVDGSGNPIDAGGTEVPGDDS